MWYGSGRSGWVIGAGRKWRGRGGGEGGGVDEGAGGSGGG